MKTQQGSVMIMVIIVMISMLMISLALLRSSETVNHMTSTITFHEATKKIMLSVSRCFNINTVKKYGLGY